jgi:uncharacterized protein (DUF433 family)
VDYQNIITIEPGKRSGKACIRGLRITVQDVLEYIASGMRRPEILSDIPDLTETDIKACLAYAADHAKLRLPRGVFRFKTHEEADDWWDQMLARSWLQKL